MAGAVIIIITKIRVKQKGPRPLRGPRVVHVFTRAPATVALAQRSR